MTSQIFRIVFEDADLLVAEKLQPFLSQRRDSGASGEGLYEFIARTTNQTLFPVHRLDREVLGLMLFAKSKAAAQSLSDQFRERSISKIYEAWVSGRPRDPQGHLVHYLKKNPTNNHVTVFPRETPGAQRAELKYEVLGERDGFTHLKIELLTGRSHQIRAQLAKVGMPILGDQRYGKVSPRKVGGANFGIQLRAHAVTFDHPQTKERMNFELDWSTSPTH